MMDGQWLCSYYSLPLTSLKSNMRSVISALLAAVQGFLQQSLVRGSFLVSHFQTPSDRHKNTFNERPCSLNHAPPPNWLVQAAPEECLELILFLLHKTFCRRRAHTDTKTSLLSEKPRALWSRLNRVTVTRERLCRNGTTSHAEHVSNTRMKWTTSAALGNTREQLNICTSRQSTAVKDGRQVSTSSKVKSKYPHNGACHLAPVMFLIQVCEQILASTRGAVFGNTSDVSHSAMIHFIASNKWAKPSFSEK